MDKGPPDRARRHDRRELTAAESAGIQRRQFEIMYDVIAIYQEAARTDPDIAEATRVIATNRENAFRRHVESIAGHLAPGVTVEAGVDRYLALVLPEIYRTFVLERRWTIDEYEAWLAGTLIQQLLAIEFTEPSD